MVSTDPKEREQQFDDWLDSMTGTYWLVVIMTLVMLAVIVAITMYGILE